MFYEAIQKRKVARFLDHCVAYALTILLKNCTVTIL